MNFEMASRYGKADEGNRKVVVNDDVAVENSTWTTGRRGIAGTIFVYKCGRSCAEKKDYQKRCQAKVITNVPFNWQSYYVLVMARGKISFELADDEGKDGMGIHGETGTHREKIRAPLLRQQIHYRENFRAEGIYNAGDEVAVMVNGLATPLQELYLAKH